MINICKLCGKEFESNSPLKKVCNREHKRICVICKEEFILDLNSSFNRIKDRNYCYKKECIKEHTIIKMKNTNQNKYGVDVPIQNKEIKEKIINTNLEKYGTKTPFESKQIQEKSKETCLKRYNTDYYMKTEEFKQISEDICLKRYGVKKFLQSREILDKTKLSLKEKYNVEHGLQSKEIYNKTQESCLRRYGKKAGTISCTNQETRKKMIKTMIKKYGVPYYIMTKNCRVRSNITKPNKFFSEELEQINIKSEFEFRLNNYSYDIHILNTNILLEINPTPYHNVTWHPFNHPKSFNYHQLKSQVAKENGYRCIHIWDWDDIDKIISLLKSKENLYARKLQIKEVSKLECKEFLNKYHLQNNCRNQSIRIGLYNGNELVQIMTFGKPRYNKNYEYELLRLCTKSDYKIIGGSEKLFKYFIEKYNPKSVISYCDNSKFSGKVYERLGFKFKDFSINKHWYNIKTKQHITDNLLRQRGFDQLFNTNYGKGSSNEDLMIQNKFVEIYDSGQSTYIYQHI